MTRAEILKRYPHASESFIRANISPDGLRPTVTKPAQRPALERPVKRQATRKTSIVDRYRITFTVFACRPMDWDNAAAGCKKIQDQLVEFGLLPDDNWKILEGLVRSCKANHKADERTEVLIERL